MNSRDGILILALVGLAGAPDASWSAQPVAGKDYYSVQLLSGKSAAALQNSLAQLAGQPYARIDKRGAAYILRVGFWESREEAVQAAQALLPSFRNAYARIASYRPDAIVASAGEQPPGASLAPPPSRAAVQRPRIAARTVEPPLRTSPEPPPATAPLPPPVTDSAPSQAQVLNLRREAQSNLLPDPELHGIYPLPPPSESAPPPREAAAPQVKAAPSPTPRERQRSRAQPSPPRGPNEVPLWNLLREERYAELEAEVSRLREAYPLWNPPTRLLALKRDAEARLQITEAVDTKDWNKVVALGEQYREQFSCNQIQFLWGLAEAHYALGQTAQAIAVYERIIPACPKTADRITTLQKAGNLLTAEVFAELVQREARGGQRDAAQQSQFDKIVYEFQLRELLQAIAIKDRPRVTAILETIERMPKAQRDARYATMASWFYIDAEQDETAAAWFETALNWKPASEESEDARYGLALAKFRLSRRSDAESVKLSVKRLDEAEAVLARANPEDARNRALLSEILFARTVDAFGGKDYDQSLAYLEQSKAQGKSGRDVAMMQAWLHYQAGEDAQAAEEFIDLYRAQPERDSAQGIVFSLARSGRWDELAGLAESLGGPLKEEADPSFSQRFYFRKLFVASDAAAPGEFAELDNIAAPNITLGAMLRDKAGIDGTSRLRVLKAPALEGAVVFNGSHEVRLQVDRVSLDSGDLPPGAAVGSFPVAGAYVAVPTTRLANGLEPYLSYQHQGTLTTYAGIGMTPSGAAVSSAPVGNLGFTRQSEGGNWGAELFSQPVRESILSYTGMVDPYGGPNWGRVRRTGGLIRGYTAISENWGVSGRLRAMSMKGQNVANNRGKGISLSLARNLTLPGFDYVSVGPDLSFDTYDKNLSGFTIGNGGYFSPRRLISLGFTANLQTAEARRYSVKGNFSLGYFDKREAESTCFPLGGLPLNPACPNAAASHASGLYYSGQLLGVWRYTNELQLGGGLIYGRNPQYNDKSVAIFMRYSFYPRPGVMSSDIPDGMFQRLY